MSIQSTEQMQEAEDNFTVDLEESEGQAAVVEETTRTIVRL